MNYCYLDTPVGALLIAGDDEAIREIRFPSKSGASRADVGWTEAGRTQSKRGAIADAARQLREYFAGRRTEFDLPLAPVGTAFQLTVWRELQGIPYGETISYGELARRVGNPQASRAVGAANGRNPIPIVIPCHRVIGANGKLTGFGGGIPTKQTLLALEARQLALI